MDARSGELRWSAKVDEHPDATVTGAVALHDGRLYVPVSSLEVVAAIDPHYACCTFRGAVVALDAATGEQIWKAHTIDEPPSAKPARTASAPTSWRLRRAGLEQPDH